MRMNATYAQIIECVKRQFGFVPKSSWMAHVKELNGLRVGRNRNRARARQVQCPPKLEPIEQCMRRLGVIRSPAMSHCFALTTGSPGTRLVGEWFGGSVRRMLVVLLPPIDPAQYFANLSR